MPLSMTAIMVEGEPVVVSHAAGALMSLPACPPVWPLFLSAHCSGKRPSLGINSAHLIRWFGSAISTAGFFLS